MFTVLEVTMYLYMSCAYVLRPVFNYFVGVELAKRGTFVYTKIKRFYVVHEPNENFLKMWSL